MAEGGSHLQLQDVTVKYGALQALASVSLEITPGEAVALVGPSGAGKTTLLKLFNGAVLPASGTIRIDGQALSTMTPAALQRVRAETGFVYQDLNLIPNLRVLQNVATGRFGRRSLPGSARDLLFPSNATIRNIYEVLDQVGIAEKLYQRTDRLSGGQQQRVAMARALYQQPRVLLCDEPVSSVDPSRARAVLNLLKELTGRRGLTLCVSLHHLELAREFFPRLIAIREGRVLFDKQTRQINREDLAEVFRLAPDPENKSSGTGGDPGRERCNDPLAAGIN